MSTGHSPLNIKSIMFPKPALCDIYFNLICCKGSYIKRIVEIKDFFNFFVASIDIRCIFALETARDRAVGSSSGS
jgi:hypothetical protein